MNKHTAHLVLNGMEMDCRVIKLAETVYDITTVAYDIIRRYPDHRPIYDNDSRELFHNILAWAAEFEIKYPDCGSAYMDTIEEYAAEKLSEYFELEALENG